MNDSLPHPHTSYSPSIFLHKKIEKITAAIYIITNLISDNEPLKWKLRESALCLLQIDTNIKDNSFFKQFESLTSILEVSYYAGMISEMNYQILKKEIEKLVEYAKDVDHKKGNIEPVSTLSSTFFSIDENTASGHVPALSRESSLKNDSIERGSVLNRQERKSKVNRQEIILEMLNKQGGLGIKDFSRAIKGCSEKTIQRELLALVKKGILVKKGERRWSTYALV